MTDSEIVEGLRTQLGEKQLSNARLQDQVRKANNRLATLSDTCAAQQQEIDRLRSGLDSIRNDELVMPVTRQRVAVILNPPMGSDHAPSSP